MISESRSIAALVLTRVWGSDAFAALALDAELGRQASLDPRDRGLATELVYGILRTQNALAERLAKLTPKGKLDLPSERAKAHLLIAAYSLCFLDRIPVFAAVSEAVSAIRSEGDPRSASFANAILRALAEDLAQKGKPDLIETTAQSAPGWLRGALRRSLGRQSAEAYLSAGPIPPPTGLCIRKDVEREELIQELQKAAPDALIEPGKLSPRAILLRNAGDARRLPYAQEKWIIQEEGAQVVALALGAKPGEKVLDACAGRGNKTWLLTGEVGPTGQVDAADLYAAKLDQLQKSPAGNGARTTYAIDWADASASSASIIPDNYDRVLVDAPCSGIGTLRRRPEITLRRTAEDILRLAELQVLITQNAARKVKPGGTLTFAVCSVLKEEAEAVVEKLCQIPAETGIRLVPQEFPHTFPKAEPGKTMCRLLPHTDTTDGYFIANFEVQRG